MVYRLPKNNMQKFNGQTFNLFAHFIPESYLFDEYFYRRCSIVFNFYALTTIFKKYKGNQNLFLKSTQSSFRPDFEHVKHLFSKDFSVQQYLYLMKHIDFFC